MGIPELWPLAQSLFFRTSAILSHLFQPVTTGDPRSRLGNRGQHRDVPGASHCHRPEIWRRRRRAAALPQDRLSRRRRRQGHRRGEWSLGRWSSGEISSGTWISNPRNLEKFLTCSQLMVSASGMNHSWLGVWWFILFFIWFVEGRWFKHERFTEQIPTSHSDLDLSTQTLAIKSQQNPMGLFWIPQWNCHELVVYPIFRHIQIIPNP